MHIIHMHTLGYIHMHINLLTYICIHMYMSIIAFNTKRVHELEREQRRISGRTLREKWEGGYVETIISSKKLKN